MMVGALARNDFRVRFAGSYFGIIWAFVQPMATILLFWFVFQVGFRARPTDTGIPYVLWLASGLTPWFFFAEAWTTVTAAFTEYSYLVKKVVFRVELLPLVKMFSALLFHIAFLLVLLVLNFSLGQPLRWHLLQLPYYGFCLFSLGLAIGTLTASILPFFRDLGQLLNIVLQFGMWLTPIMWPIAMVPAQYRWIFKLNPVGYVVEGYRDSLFGLNWVWQHGPTTAGFWAITLAISVLASRVHKRLRPHFPDVL